MDAIPNCVNKTRLLAEYQEASEAYSKAIFNFSGAVGRNARIKYARLNLLAKRARLYAEARKNLDLHTYQHGC